MIQDTKLPRQHSAILLLLAILSGCTVGPAYQAPEPAAPEQWQDAAGVAGARDEQWWQRFDDPVLAGLVERALTANHDLRIAGLRVQQAQAMRAAVSGGFYPGVDSSASATRDSFSENGPNPWRFCPVCRWTSTATGWG